MTRCPKRSISQEGAGHLILCRLLTLSFAIVPGEKFADNYPQLLALRRGAMEHASVCEVGGVAPLRVLSAFLLIQADFGLKGHGGITCGMKSGACAMA